MFKRFLRTIGNLALGITIASGVVFIIVIGSNLIGLPN